jgi:hypothetical protein
LVVVRATTSLGLIPGKALQSSSVAYIPAEGFEYQYDSYEVEIKKLLKT